MVIPSMPIFFSASLTSSILNGCTTASIFFIPPLVSFTLSLEEITFFTVLAEIETLFFAIRVHAHPDQHVANLEDNQRSHDREPDGNQHPDRLIQNLSRIAVHQPQRDHFSVD